MASAHTHPASAAPMPAVARILSRFDRQSLAGFIAVAIDLLDTLDGDDDCEDNGDATDHNQIEDEALDYSRFGNGPGCDVGDPDAEHDGREPEHDAADEYQRKPPQYASDQRIVLHRYSAITGTGLNIDTMRDQRF